MSQGGILTTTVPVGGAVNTLTSNTGGAVGADIFNNINVVAGTGLTGVGSPGSSTITFSLTSANEGTTTTVGAVTGNVITLALGATPATYAIEARIAGFEASTPAGCAYQVFGCVRTDGVTATLIGTPDFVINEEAALVTADIDLIVSGNNAILQVTGVAVLTIDWKGFSLFTMVS